MPVFRVEKHCEFTVIANCVFKDKTLSARAEGLLAEILSLPDDWDYSLKGLAGLFSDGIDSIRQGIVELEKHGYIVRKRKRDSKGRLGKMEYVFYDVVIFGYIRAVQEYLAKPRLRTYAFSTVAWKQMQCAVSNYCRYMAVPKRAAPVVSLSAPVCSEMECTWEDVLSEQDNEFLRFETRELLKQMEKELPKQEMKIIRMKLGGWNMHEIASREHLTFQEINALLANCKDDISVDYEKISTLAALCNHLELSPIHLWDVVEDFLAGQ